MKTKLEIVKAYERFLKSLKKENSDIIGDFGKMYNYLNNEVSKIDVNLWQVLTFDCVGRTLQQARDRKLRFKTDDYDWNQYSVERCYKLIDNIIKADYTQDRDSFNINVYRLFKLMTEEEEEPNVILYMWHTYSKTECGRIAVNGEKERVRKMLKASTEEELEKALAE